MKTKKFKLIEWLCIKAGIEYQAAILIPFILMALA